MKQYFPANLTKVFLVFRASIIRPKLTYVIGLFALALTLVWLPLPVSLAAGPDGTLDHTFQSGKGPGSSISAIAVQSDGKILIGGDFTNYNDVVRNRIARLNSDGSLDTSFNIGSGVNSSISAIVVQADGKIIIGGQFNSYNGVFRNSIARLNSDGTLDTSFSAGNLINGPVYAVAVQSDGKILAGGGFFRNIIRLNSNGTQDSGFTVGNGASGVVQTIGVQSDGKILIGGFFTDYNGTALNNIARLNSNGTLDTSFNTGSGSNGFVLTSAIQSDGKILIGGAFTSYNGTARNYIARVNNNGSLDSSFNPSGGPGNTVNTLVLQSDGKIMIGGWFANYSGTTRLYVARVNSNGTLDSSFSPQPGAGSLVFAVAVQSDGKVLLGGNFTSYNGNIANRLVRANTDGTMDSSFNPGSGANGPVYAIAVQGDGKILLGGVFTVYNGTTVNNIARLNSDGTLDSSFNPGGSGADGFVYSIAVQNDGKILLGGNFQYYNGTVRSSIARLNSDGTLDSSFTPGGGTNSIINAIAIQNDGKILIAGQFTLYNGVAINRIARLNSDGTLDSSFNPGGGANSTINAVAVQGDGKIVIGGYFTDYNGTAINWLARLNSDGTLDNSFNSGGFDNIVNAIGLQSDSKILLGGNFSSYNGTVTNRIARLNNDGTLDSSFTSGTAADNQVVAVVAQSDGKILIGGNFTNYNGVTINRIARLNNDGTLDEGFNPGTGANNVITTLAVQNDGKVLLGGWFTTVANYPRDRIARLENTVKKHTSLALISNSNPTELGQNVTFTATITPVTATGSVTFRFDTGGGSTLVNATLTNGIASYMTSTLPLGDTPVQVSYAGNATFLPSTSPVYTQTITKITTTLNLTSNPNPSQYGQQVTFTATVGVIAPGSGVPDGAVSFFVDGINVDTVNLNNGVASYVTSTLTAGNYPVTAIYSGSSQYSPSQSGSPLIQEVQKATTNLSLLSSSNPVVGGTNVTFTATVSPVSASGVVTFTFNGLTQTVSPVVNGVATYLTSTLPAGTHNVTAIYSGDANYFSSSAPTYTQFVCNPLIVTNNQDDGQATTCGTFSYALLSASSGMSITFSLTSGGNLITFTDSLTPTLKAGVSVDGGVNGVILNGNGVASDGLRLGGNNILTSLTIRNFGGHELLAAPGSKANQLFRVKVQS